MPLVSVLSLLLVMLCDAPATRLHMSPCGQRVSRSWCQIHVWLVPPCPFPCPSLPAGPPWLHSSYAAAVCSCDHPTNTRTPVPSSALPMPDALHYCLAPHREVTPSRLTHAEEQNCSLSSLTLTSDPNMNRPCWVTPASKTNHEC